MIEPCVSQSSARQFQERGLGAKGVNHVTIKDGGHFLQEDQPEQLSEAIINFING
ncbi:hypothetical protein [Parasphingorhabdus halotolerans]|uniref:Haloalkane dehalogenase n=1 Tax=Parasphingorhabdus halotolerans TaxID=2725558 RepID=A0A6H2DNE7_9SPHN|nr:hypothetical protein [Parasphingorhabdus halotolerans]QJB69513.1 hypothetical protein HF685_09655 [Parasphingorhabdus halotolerans]